MLHDRSLLFAQTSLTRLPLALSMLLTAAAFMLPSTIQGQTVTLHLTGQVDGLQDDLAFFPAVSIGSPFAVDFTYSVNTALYTRVFSQFQADNLFLPNQELVSWTASFPGRTLHHDDLTDNVGLTNQNYFQVRDQPAGFSDQVFVQTDRRDTAAGVTDQLAMQMVLNGPGTAFPGGAELTIPSELELAPWTFMKTFAVQYASTVETGPPPHFPQISLAYGEIDTLTILDMPGFSMGNPMLPSPDPGFVCTGDICHFFVALTSAAHGVNTPLWFDPEIAVGYDYAVASGPNISGIELPSGFGDDQYDVYYYDEVLGQYVFAATVGDAAPLDLTTFDAAGFARVRVLGIETDAMVDAEDPLAFPTGLTFLSAGQVELTMTPITLVPEPSTLVLLGIAAVLGLWRRRA